MNRFGVAVLWFVLLFAWNLVTKTSPDVDGFVYRCLDAVSDMTTPLELLLSAIAMVAIWKQVWKRKTLPLPVTDVDEVSERSHSEGQ